MKNIILAIHGVGETKEGEIIQGMSEALEIEKLKVQQTIINASSYLEATDENKTLKIVEINWSHLMKPKKSIYSTIRHIAFLMTAMLSFAVKSYRENFAPNGFFGYNINLASSFRFFLESLVLGSSLMPIVASVSIKMNTLRGHENGFTPEYGTAILILTAICVTYLFLIIKGQKYSKYYYLGWPILLAMLSIIFFSFRNLSTEIQDNILICSEFFRDKTTALVMTFWLLIFFRIIWKYFKNSGSEKKKGKKEHLLTLLAYLSIPFIAFTSLSTMLTLLYAVLLNIEGTTNLTYDLWPIEIVGTIIYIIIGIIPIVIGVMYFYYKGKMKKEEYLSANSNSKGIFVQNGLSIFLKATPWLLFILVFYISYIYYTTSSTSKNIVEIYSWSITRLFPFAAWVIGPLAIFLDVLGDILFYLEPNTKLKYALKNPCTKKIDAVISHYSKDKSINLVIVAHSWGSVLVHDYLNDNPIDCSLITIGSPIESLCKRFMEKEISMPKNLKSWINAYRFGDYIASPIHIPEVKNKLIEEGGHTNYWSSSKLGSIIQEALIPIKTST